MATRIIWSPLAADDLEQIVAFIARDSDRYAAQVGDDIVRAVENCLLFPRAGRVVPELRDLLIRETFIYQYRIIYRIHDDSIHVAAIIHGARELKNALGNRVC